MSVARAAEETNAAGAYDLKFIDAMSQHHQMAVDMANVAKEKAGHEELRAFAAKVIDAQTKEIGQMRTWRGQWFPDAAQATMDHGMPGMAQQGKPGMAHGMRGMGDAMGMDMSPLQRANAADFDRVFVDMMTKHHEGALKMGNEALAIAQRPEVKALARKMIDDQTQEIAQMKTWRQAWFAPSKDTVPNDTQYQHE